MSIFQGTEGNDNITGSNYNDVIYGKGGNDYLLGDGGNDTIYGGNGYDTLNGGEGNDVLYGEDGDDLLYGLAGDDYLDGGTGSDTMYGGAGNDTYVVDSLDDEPDETVRQGSGIDTVIAQVNGYTLGEDIENLILDEGKAKYGYGNELNNEMHGNSYNNSLYGYGGNDTLMGYDGDDMLKGGEGDDILNGGIGDDFMYGGEGNDIYVVQDEGDQVIEYENEGYDQVNVGILKSYTLTDDVENLVLLEGGGTLNGTGNSLDNAILGNELSNTLSGLDGNDILNGGLGDDTMYGGKGDDIFVVQDAGDVVIENANEGIDQVNVGVLQGYILPKNIENLVLLEGAGTSIGLGNTLDNKIQGNELSNMITGLDGNDTLMGMAGDDTLSGDNGNDLLYGGTGDDYLFGGEGNDTYLFSAGDQMGIIQDTSGTDSILFDNSVSKDNIAFFMDEENNLHIDYGETAGQDLIGVVDQVNGTIEHIQVGNYSISNTAIEQLIQDMSAYITEQGLVIDSVEDVKANAELMTMVNSAWTSAA